MQFSPAALRVPSVLAIALLVAAVCCSGVGSSSQEESSRRGKCASVDPSVSRDGGGGGRGTRQHSECKAGSGSLYPFGFTMDSGKPIRMAITMPVTSRGHPEGKPISEMRIFTSFLSRDSFQGTVVPAGFPLEFNFYIGYDLGDPILDSEGGRKGFAQAFREATNQVECSAGSKGGPCTTLNFMGFNHTNTLTALWNGLNAKAYMDGCHYIFMPNDDLRMLTKGWPETFITALYESPILPNLGVTGPVDPVSGRKDMSSMPCISRLHMDIFGSDKSLPPSFKNWYNDVWLGNVYRPFRANLMARGVQSRNHDGCIDKSQCSRYELGDGARVQWTMAVAKGRLQVSKWLEGQGVATPMVAGLINDEILI